MEAIDATGWYIAAGAIGAIFYMAVEIIRHKTVDTRKCLVVFLTILAVIGGGDLIWAAFQGDPEKLPLSWRGYLAGAGVVAIGMSLNSLMNMVKELFSTQGQSPEQDK